MLIVLNSTYFGLNATAWLKKKDVAKHSLLNVAPHRMG